MAMTPKSMALLLGDAKPDPVAVDESAPDVEGTLITAAGDLMECLKSGDKAGVVEALRAAVMALTSAPHSEYGE